MEQQQIADRFLPVIDKASGRADQRAGRNLLGAFERAPWHSDWFNAVIAEAAPELGSSETLTLPGETGRARALILAVLKGYLERVAAYADWPDNFGTHEAKEYVALYTAIRGKPLGLWGVQDHIDSGDLKGRLIGKTRVFTREQLDAFVEWYMNADIKPGPERGTRLKSKQPAS